MDFPIRVLCVFSTLDRGGAETMCMNLYRKIDRSKLQFDFIKHTGKIGDYEREIDYLGGRVFSAPRYRLYNHITYCRWWEKHFKEHPEHKIVHGHFFGISSVYFSVAKKWDRVTVAHSHIANTLVRDPKEFIKQLMVKRIENYSDYNLACSKEAGKWLFSSGKYTVLNNAISSNEFIFNQTKREIKRKELELSNQILIGTVGRFDTQKNPFGIIEIINHLVKKNDTVRFLWIGDGALRPQIEAKLQAYGIADNVIFTGVRSDVNELLQTMDVFIFPSFYEGLGVAVIEAQAAGLPCFISDTVPREVAITNLSKFLPLENYEVWADEILKADISKRENTQQQVIGAGYDIHTTAKWLQDFYIGISEQGAESCQH